MPKLICAAPGCDEVVPPAKGTRPRLYHSDACRNRAHRLRGGSGVAELPAPSVGPSEASPAGLVAAVRRDLEKAERLDTVAGQQALEAAARAVSPGTSSSAVPGLMKALDVAMAKALSGVVLESDELDELAKRRAIRVASA